MTGVFWLIVVWVGATDMAWMIWAGSVAYPGSQGFVYVGSACTVGTGGGVLIVVVELAIFLERGGSTSVKSKMPGM